MALCVAPLACAMSDSAGGTGAPVMPPPLPDTATIRFDATDTLALGLGATRVVGVTASPPGPYAVRFSLVGDAFDATLDQAVVLADGSGHASVSLRAPLTATAFRLRASLLDPEGQPGASAERAVAVSDQGFGAVRVTPNYLGQRPITGWTAAVVAGKDCNALVGVLPDEPPGALVATAAAGTDPVILNAPVGPDLAVTLRAGHYAWGCAPTKALAPGATLDVAVTVIDKPLDLGSANLDVTFEYEPDPASWAALLSASVGAFADAFIPDGSKEGTVILNAMAALVPAASMGDFMQKRIDKGWDTLAEQHFAVLCPDLRTQAAAWATAGMLLQSNRFQATLGPGAAPGQASLTLTRFGDLDPSAAGAAAAPGFTWSAQPDDTVLLGGELVWEPARFAGSAALAGAQQDNPAISAVPAALALLADCHGLAQGMGSFGACDVACVEQLCTDAVAARYAGALDASKLGGPLGKVVVKASAAAPIGDVAEPVALDGSWLGSVAAGSVEAPVTGSVAAAAPPPPP
jgi:hypothetical protein